MESRLKRTRLITVTWLFILFLEVIKISKFFNFKFFYLGDACSGKSFRVFVLTKFE